jgi:hypothetical protein
MTAFRAILVGVTIALVGLAQLMCCCVLSPAAKSLLGEEHRAAAVGCCHHHGHSQGRAPEKSGPEPAEHDCTCDLSNTLAPLSGKPRVYEQAPAPECPFPELPLVMDSHVSISNWRPVWPEWESPGRRAGPPQIPLQMGVRFTI